MIKVAILLLNLVSRYMAWSVSRGCGGGKRQLCSLLGHNYIHCRPNAYSTHNPEDKDSIRIQAEEQDEGCPLASSHSVPFDLPSLPFVPSFPH